MGRPRKLWKRAENGYYYTKIDGVQTRLEKTLGKSQQKLEQLLKGDAQAPVKGGMTFARLADRFLDHSKSENEPDTYETHRLFLQSFKDFVGNRLVSALCEADLDDWCRERAATPAAVKAGGRKGGTRTGTVWSKSTQARAKAVVLACLNYGVKKLNMPAHPLRHVKPGAAKRREKILTSAEKKIVRAALSGPMLDFVIALELTGARPFSEVCRVTAADVDLEKGTWTLKMWKNSKKHAQAGIKKDRVIYLVPEMVGMTRRLMKLYPEGPLFRGKSGSPYSKQTITARMRSLGAKLQIPDLTCYCWRHTAITEALLRGVPAAVCAELYGTSIQTISKSYSHVNQKGDELRQAMLRATGG